MSQSSKSAKQSFSYKSLLALGALGVVYGDIGTSPLYALKEAFNPAHNVSVVPENILSLLSLIFWSLTIVISIKYLVFILRADNKGEGGILALTSMIAPYSENPEVVVSRSKNVLILMGLFGAALLFGDGMITPAISILSAVEGLKLITPVFEPYIIPITLGILIGLFSLQKKGTGAVGQIFGPVTLVWFIVLAILGVTNILESPEVLKALNPIYIISFFQNNAWHGFVVLGSVFLVVTGGEALYSDLGHFGRTPIRQAWFFVALPALVLNYFGQGALLLRQPEAISNPFYLLAPSWALYPLVVLAALATTIASQALITGVFSLTLQAVQSGFAPRLHIAHTSKDEVGQIYVKNMNRLLMIGSMGLVVMFKTSSNLAAAYGLAVTTTMVITTILFYFYVRESWKWSRLTAGLICGAFLVIDLGFWGSNLLKIVDGGWFPVLIGLLGFTFMTTWKTGKKLLRSQLNDKNISVKDFLEKITADNTSRIEGIAIYLNQSLKDAPYSLIHTFEHFKVVHRHLIFLNVTKENISCVPAAERRSMYEIADGHFQIILRYGYLDQLNIAEDIAGLQLPFGKIDVQNVSFIIGRESLYATHFPGMAIWREKLFSLIAKNEISATDYFQLPKNRVVEVGIQVAL